MRGVKYAGSFGLLTLLPLANIASGQTNFTCISLHDSRTCQNFSSASISTSLVADFPFLAYVSTVEEFDTQFTTFIKQQYAMKKYQDTLDCQGINLSNTSYLYARFTQTVLCGQMVQESIQPCQLSPNDAPTVCAGTCAEFATSEETIVMTPEFCGGSSSSLTDLRINLIRADFTVCALPNNSLSSSCVDGLVNEPQNCGFGTNLPQLCTYCGRSSPNATSFCCLSSNLTACSSINIPPTRPLPPIFTSTVTASATGTNTSKPSTGGSPGQHLPTGAIVGISIAAAIVGLLLAGLCFFFCLRRRSDDSNRSLRQKTSQVPMSCGPFPERNGYANIEDETRVRRMAALHSGGPVFSSPEITPPRTERTRRTDNSSSSENNPLSSPEGGSPLMMGTLPPRPGSPSRQGVGWTAGAAAAGVVAGAAIAGSRSGNGGKRGSKTSTTLSSTSPGDGSEAASVSEVADHYSTNTILRQSEVVALWTYTPRLADEMGLERGDVVKIENLYDDNWAIGRKLKTKVWDMVDVGSSQRDSGIGTSHRESSSTAHRASLEAALEPPRSSDKGKEKEVSDAGSVKAFPMVCVCHRDAWAEVVAREEEESTSPTPDLGRRRLSPTRLDLGVSDPQGTSRKETRFEHEETLSSSDNSPAGRGRGIPRASPPSRSSSQGSRFRDFST